MSTPDLSGRHPVTRHHMTILRPNPQLNGVAGDVAALLWGAACDLVTILGDGPELSSGLRKLWEAKNSLVMQGLLDSGTLHE